MMTPEQTRAALERLCKWRSVFAGWQLGTRTKEDPESQAVRDHREVTILLRAELNALTALLIRNGVITAEEFTEAVGEEAEVLSESFAKRFPGMRATDEGIVYSRQAAETMKNWPP